MTPDLEATLRAALARATAGDWFAVEADSMKYCSAVEFQYASGARGSIGLVGRDGVTVGASELDQQNANAAFITLAKNHMGDLLDTLTSLRAQVEGLRRNADAWVRWYELADAGDDCEYLNGKGWPDAEALASTTMGLLASLKQESSRG